MKTKLITIITAVVFVILASSTVVLATDITYDDTTYTEINEGSDLKITVSYKVNYYEEGEQATLLVLSGSEEVQYDAESGEPANIVFADQQLITGDNGSFTFILKKNKILANKVYVKLGATSKTPAEEITAAVITEDAVTFEDANNIVKEYKSGYGGGYVAMDEDVVFVVDRGTLATNIRYRVYDSESGEWGADRPLTPDGSDQCTIPGSSITGNVQLVADRFAEGVTVQLVSNFNANVKELWDKQLCAIHGTSASDTYIVNGKAAFWSSKYNAHVVWIDSAETLTGLIDAVEVQVGVPATEIVYDGDINGNGRTTAADATVIKDCLHGKRKLATSEMQLFKLDVDANMQVTTADIVQILKIAVGK